MLQAYFADYTGHHVYTAHFYNTQTWTNQCSMHTLRTTQVTSPHCPFLQHPDMDESVLHAHFADNTVTSLHRPFLQHPNMDYIGHHVYTAPFYNTRTWTT